jgi:integrase
MGKNDAKRAMQAELTAVNNLKHSSTTTITFRQYAKAWLEDCKNRNQHPNKRGTLTIRKSVLTKHVLPCLGDIPLSSVDNKAMRTLVAGLVRKKLSPQSVTNILTVAKLVKASAVDENGDRLYATKWNNRFIDAPTVNKEEQRRPIFTADQVASIVTAASGKLQMACILFAASGLRAGELLGLELRHFDGSSVKIEQSIWGGKVQPPKTPNAKRYVDLHPAIATLLAAFIGDRKSGFVFETGSGRPLGQSNLLNAGLHPLLETLGISKQGFHCFRRFRNTYLRQQRCSDSILKTWMGQATGGICRPYMTARLRIRHTGRT